MRRPHAAAAALAAVLLCLSVAVHASEHAASSHKLLMIPGPVEISESVLAAAGGLPVSHMDKGFAEEFGQVLDMLRKVFMTDFAQPYVLAGSGSLGWDIVGANLVERGEKVLVVNSGYFSDKFADALDAYGISVDEVRPNDLGHPPSLEQIEEAFTRLTSDGSKFKAVTITQVDTSTGVLMDVKAVAALIRRLSPDTLIVVDGVCSVGAEELRMDDWGIDFVLTASQKALGAPPGLCIALASRRALRAVAGRVAPIASHYVSLERWQNVMTAYERGEASYFATPPVQLVRALKVSLTEILGSSAAKGKKARKVMEARFKAHVDTSNRVKDTIESWGLRLMPVSREVEAHTLTAVRLPEGITAADLLPRVSSRGVVVAGGLFPNVPYFRIGHMHLSATTNASHIDDTLAAVREALMELGYAGVASPEAVAKLRESGWEPRIRQAAASDNAAADGTPVATPDAATDATAGATTGDADAAHDEL